MAIYTYICKNCDKTVERISSIANYIQNPKLECATCFENLERVIEAPMIQRDKTWTDLRATDGTDISSRNKHREYMKKNNLIPFDEAQGDFKDAQKLREKHYTDGSDDKVARRETVKQIVERVYG